MRLLETLEVRDGSAVRRLQLLQGDLTRIPAEHAVDVLVVSAFPRNYLPIGGTLIGALDDAGLSVGDLSQRPEADLRENFACWISHKIERQRRLRFDRVLCFEPATLGRAPDVVEGIFRAVAPFVHAEPGIRSVALPLLATGSQSYPVREMTRALVGAAWAQLSAGLPLDVVKIVVHREGDVKEALKHFRAPSGIWPWRKRAPRVRSEPPRGAYEVFVSYSRTDKAAARIFSDALSAAGIRVFIDTREIETGSDWQQRIWDALENCGCAAALYSPSFLASNVCKDEFNAAMILRRRRGENFIFPLLLRDSRLPAYMEMLSYQDCRVSDHAKLKAAASTLAEQVRARRR